MRRSQELLRWKRQFGLLISKTVFVERVLYSNGKPWIVYCVSDICLTMLVSVYTYVGGSWSTHKVTTVWVIICVHLLLKEGGRRRRRRNRPTAGALCFSLVA